MQFATSSVFLFLLQNKDVDVEGDNALCEMLDYLGFYHHMLQYLQDFCETKNRLTSSEFFHWSYIFFVESFDPSFGKAGYSQVPKIQILPFGSACMFPRQEFHTTVTASSRLVEFYFLICFCFNRFGGENGPESCRSRCA